MFFVLLTKANFYFYCDITLLICQIYGHNTRELGGKYKLEFWIARKKAWNEGFRSGDRNSIFDLDLPDIPDDLLRLAIPNSNQV